MTTRYLLLRQLALSELVWWRRWCIQFAYWCADWYGPCQIDFRSVATSKDHAREMVNEHGSGEDGWVIVPLPLDEILPRRSVNYEGGPIYVSPNGERHELKPRPLVAKPIAEIKGEQHTVEAAIQQVDRIRSKLKAYSATAL